LAEQSGSGGGLVAVRHDSELVARSGSGAALHSPAALGPRNGWGGPGIDIAWLVHALLRNWWVVALTVALCTGLAAFVLKSMPASYTAATEVLIERDETEFGNLREGFDFAPRGISAAEMETHLRLLASDSIARRVIERLELEPPAGREGALDRVMGWLDGVVDAVNLRIDALAGDRVEDAARPLAGTSGDHPEPAAGDDPSSGRPYVVTESMLEDFQANLAIRRDPLAHVISIAYRDESPVLAATISNEIAAVFLEELVGTERAMLNQTADYLRERVEVVGAELDAVERAANKYQTEEALLRVQGSSGAELRYVELSRELSLAEADLVRAAARANQVQQPGGIDTLAESGTSPVITELRRQEAEMNRRVAELGTLFGDRHPSMINARAELRDVRRSLEREQQRLVSQVATEREVAETRVGDLRLQLAELEATLGRNTTAQVQLDQFESRSETTRRTYEDLLARYQRATEQQHLLRSPARIVSPARPPARPDSRRALLVLGFTAAGSLAGGVGLALAREAARRQFETGHELEATTGIPVIGTLPLVRERTMLQAQQPDRELAAVIYAEAVQRIAIRLFPPTGVPRGRSSIITVTSAVPDEGKSLVSVSLATHLARLGASVLLIDADLRKRTIFEYFAERGAPPVSDLADLLLKPGLKLDDAVMRDPETGLDVLPVQRRHDNTVRLLGSPAMNELLVEARRRYDVVIIDTPPVLAVNDQAVVSGFADSLLFVVRAGTTPRRAVTTALREIRSIGLPLKGLILNRVNIGRYSRMAPDEYMSYYQSTTKYYGS
jgi:capsular exopolysaccharide synthesis family protein